MVEVKDIQIIRGGTGGCDVKAVRVLPDGGEQLASTSFSEDEVGGMDEEQIKQRARRLFLGDQR